MNICLGDVTVDYNGARADEREKNSTYHTISIPFGSGRCDLRRTGASSSFGSYERFLSFRPPLDRRSKTYHRPTSLSMIFARSSYTRVRRFGMVSSDKKIYHSRSTWPLNPARKLLTD